MATYSKKFLSQSVNGKAVNISATGVPGTLIHQTQNSGSIDEMWLYASNNSDADITFRLMYGGSGISLDSIYYGTVDAYAGTTLLVPGLLLEGTGSTGCSIYGYSNVASGINIFGYANRIS
jgi:hypothetical protein